MKRLLVSCDWLFKQFYKLKVLETLCNSDSSCSETIEKYMNTMILLENNFIQCATSLPYLISLYFNRGSMPKKIAYLSSEATSYLKEVT